MAAIAGDRNRARLIIVSGFAVAALGALISLITWISDGGLRYSSANRSSFSQSTAESSRSKTNDASHVLA